MITEYFIERSSWLHPRRVVDALAWRGRQVRVAADHDLVDDRAVLTLLDPHRVRPTGFELDVRARRSPPGVGRAPAVRRRTGGPRLEDELAGSGGADSRVDRAGRVEGIAELHVDGIVAQRVRLRAHADPHVIDHVFVCLELE